MKHHYSNYGRQNNRPKDYTKAIISALNRAYRDAWLNSGELNRMINYVTTHYFKRSPAQGIHSIIDMYNHGPMNSAEANRQVWNLLRNFSS